MEMQHLKSMSTHKLQYSQSCYKIGFPKCVSLSQIEADHALYEPVIQTDGQLAAVVELWRHDPFHEEDEEIASSYLVWGGIALHYAQLYLSMNKQRKLNDFLLAVVK
jgi:cAMP and cAMP-inhibited cGMP 3',5'-cyclic phosphodiesterase 10